MHCHPSRQQAHTQGWSAHGCRLHYLMDHYCSLAAASCGADGAGGGGGGGGLRLVLCPCAVEAVHQGTPVDCSCSARAPAGGVTETES